MKATGLMLVGALLAAAAGLGVGQDTSGPPGGPPSDQPTAPAAPPVRPAVLESPVEGPLPAALQEVTAALAQAQVLRARYNEEKRLTVLRKPLRSEGRLILVPGRGIARHMERPFRSEWIITRTHVVQRHPDGATEVLVLAAQPMARAFVEAFLSVASGDEGSLRKTFRLHFRGAFDGWTIGFVPREEPLVASIAWIVLSGHRGFIDSLVVQEASGDSTRTDFLDATHGPPLSPEEERDLFEW